MFRIYSDLFPTERNGKEVRSGEALTDSLHSIDVNFRTQSLNVSFGLTPQKSAVFCTLGYWRVSCDSHNKQICFLKQRLAKCHSNVDALRSC